MLAHIRHNRKENNIMRYYAKKPLFPSLKDAGARGRSDGKKGPWLESWDMTKDEWYAYLTGAYRMSCPGTGNRRQRRHADDVCGKGA